MARLLPLAVLAALAAGLPSCAAPDPPAGAAAGPAELPFEPEIRAFAEADRARPPARGGILLVGSSIFREWTEAAEMLAPLPVLNRAFGGSRTGDQLARFDRVVAPYAPRVIVYYCGSNDIKAGEEPAAIFERFKAFSGRVRRSLPGTRLVFVSATRSPDRVPLWERVDHYNGLARAHCDATPHRAFVDINPALVDGEGRPRLELYRPDMLHFLPPAYAEFAAIIQPVLQRVWEEAAAPPPR